MRYVNVTEEFLDTLWKRVRKSAGVFSLLEGRSREDLAFVLYKSFIILEFPFGIVRVADMRFGESCTVHGIFWSPSVWRQLGHLKIAIDHLFVQYKLKKICCPVPSGQRSLRRLLEALGFKKVQTAIDYYEVARSCVLADIYAIVETEENHG